MAKKKVAKKPKLPKPMSVLEAVRVNVALRRLVSMDGYYRYDLTAKQRAEADELCAKLELIDKPQLKEVKK